jgi:hypothetical protein
MWSDQIETAPPRKTGYATGTFDPIKSKTD